MNNRISAEQERVSEYVSLFAVVAALIVFGCFIYRLPGVVKRTDTAQQASMLYETAVREAQKPTSWTPIDEDGLSLATRGGMRSTELIDHHGPLLSSAMGNLEPWFVRSDGEVTNTANGTLSLYLCPLEGSAQKLCYEMTGKRE